VVRTTCPPKRSSVIMLVNWDKKGGIKAIPLSLISLIIGIEFIAQSVSVFALL